MNLSVAALLLQQMPRSMEPHLDVIALGGKVKVAHRSRGVAVNASFHRSCVFAVAQRQHHIERLYY